MKRVPGRGADYARPLQLPLEPVRKIYSYCDQHRKLLGGSPKPRRDTTGNLEVSSHGRVVRRPAPAINVESSDDESAESCTCQLDKSGELIRQYEQRQRASCLKSAPGFRSPRLDAAWRPAGGRSGKRVNFHEPRGSKARPSLNESSLNEYSWPTPTPTSSSSYLEPEQFQAVRGAALVKRPGTPRERGGQEPRQRDSDTTSATFTYSKYSSAASRSTRPYKPARVESTKLDSLPVDLSELSISGERRSETRPPRVVKPRDGMRRPSTRRMLVYPPDGQTGPPLTLAKKWSNIECSVRGDETNGYRYKVYYLQTFESDAWYPNHATGSPFKRVEDAECSTDNG